MRILIFEHICGGGLVGHPLPAELAREGGAMLTAAIDDFAAIGAEVVTLLDARLDLKLSHTQIHRIETANDLNERFEELAKSADAVLVIAPEFDDLLEAWAQRVLSLNRRWLGCSPQAIALCGDKFALATHLKNHDLPTPSTEQGLPDSELLRDGPRAVKPRFGVGCEDTFIVRSAADLASLPKRDDFIHQPFMPGIAASASLIVHGDSVRPLLAGFQSIRASDPADPALRYHGGELPLPAALHDRAMRLAERAVHAVPGLHGYVGVDLILSESAEQDTIIEINPRLTVSFTALRLLCKTSLAAAMLASAAPLTWHDERIVFNSAGERVMETVT